MCLEEKEIRSSQHQEVPEALHIQVEEADNPFLVDFLLVLEEDQKNLVAVDYMEDCLRLRQDS